MRKIMSIFILLLFSCNSLEYISENDIQNDGALEKLDFASYNKRFDENKEWQKTDFFSKGIFIQEGNIGNYYYQYIQKPNTCYAVSKEYYKNGNVKDQGYVFGGNVQIGIWKHYNENGILENKKNEDDKFEKYDYNDVINFLKNKKIAKSFKDLNNIEINFLNETKEWHILKKIYFKKKYSCKNCVVGTMDKFVINAKNKTILEEKRNIKIYQDFDDISQ